MADRTLTINGRDYVTDEAAAANTREAVEPLLAEIERLKNENAELHEDVDLQLTKDATIPYLRAELSALRALHAGQRRTIADLLTQLATVTAERDAIREALQMMVDHDVDYARINNLGDPEKQHRIKISRDALARLPSGPVTAADVQRARERVSPRFGETILPAMTIHDDGRVDAGMKERDWFETPMSLISSPPVADGIPEWSGADGGRDGA